MNCYHCNKKIKILKENRTLYCPECGGKYYDKPKLEPKLFLLQDKFVEKNRDKTILNEIMTVLYPIVTNLAYKKVSKKGQFCEDYVMEIVQQTMFYMARHYNKPSFVVCGSFTGYVSKVMLHPLYNNKKQKRESLETSLDQYYNIIEKKEIVLDLEEMLQ